MIKVECEVQSHDEPSRAPVKVHSHWTDPSKVVIEFDSRQVTVLASELSEAIAYASRTNKSQN